MYFHAGAFLTGGREFGAGTLSWLAEQGLVGISVGYRLTSDAQGRGIAGCIESAWAALRYVRAHADELGIDPSQVVAMGDSAGGLATCSPDSRARVEPWALACFDYCTILRALKASVLLSRSVSQEGKIRRVRATN